MSVFMPDAVQTSWSTFNSSTMALPWPFRETSGRCAKSKTASWTSAPATPCRDVARVVPDSHALGTSLAAAVGRWPNGP